MTLRSSLVAAALGAAILAPVALGYSTYGTKWTTSSVTMHLQLGATGVALSDGFASWGASAEDALQIWNSHIGASKFAVVRDSTASRTERNRLNNVFFSGDVYGQSWGTGVLAVTVIYTSGGAQSETDVLFNNQLAWNSYRGALRTSGGSNVYDFHRVALHEFGHALGLDHPDENGQTVSALMNSRVSSLDALTSDDIAGAQSLYGSATTVVPPPTILTHPTSRSAIVGQSTTFAVAASSTISISYQWMKSGNPIVGATGASFTLGSVTLADAGSYTVRVSNTGGSVTSNAATLSVTNPTTTPPPAPPPSTPTAVLPTIATQPANQIVLIGATATFSVTVNGTTPLVYQWRKDGVAIPGATNALLSVSNVQPSHVGNYTVAVSNSAGTVTSSIGVLSLHTAPMVLTPPADQTVVVGRQLRLSVVASGTSPLSYAWRKDGATLAGATASIYEVNEVQLSHAGTYSVVVSSIAGSVNSAAARVTITPLVPAVATAPTARTVTVGEATTFNVTASGTPPFTYQWMKDGQPIAGATEASLTLPVVRAADAGNYTVRISNPAGGVTSAAAALAVRSSRLVNLSTRAFVPAGGTLTPGFFVRGSGTKPLLIRAVGPTLRRFGVESALSETRLEVLPQGSSTPLSREREVNAISDNEAAAIVGAFPLDPGGKDASIQASITPRGYTVRVSPGDPTMTGVTLAEIYDADAPGSPAQIINVSTLGFVGAGENQLTAGFVISGNAPKRLLLRAIGPGLAPFGVSGILTDPQIALVPQGRAEPLAANDDWPDTPSLRTAFGGAGAFALPGGSKDAALLITLEPGAYTVMVSSVITSVTGQALVEIYDLDP